MNALELALWHLTGALRNAKLHRGAFCHAKRYPLRGRWVDGTRWPDLEGCAKCQRTLRRVSYAYTLAVVLCRQERRYLKALTFEQRYGGPAAGMSFGFTASPLGEDLEAALAAFRDRPAFQLSGRFHVVHPKLTQEPRPWAQDLLRTAPGRMTPYAREWLAGVAEAEDRQGPVDAGQALPPESPTTV